MAIDFMKLSHTFPSHTGGPQSFDLTFTFPTNVHRAEAVVAGFEIGFSSSDHHLFRIETEARVRSITFGTVVVSVTYALRDSSGFFDDAYNGTVQVLTMVDRT
jgi:hypothetical protein